MLGELRVQHALTRQCTLTLTLLHTFDLEAPLRHPPRIGPPEPDARDPDVIHALALHLLLHRSKLLPNLPHKSMRIAATFGIV